MSFTSPVHASGPGPRRGLLPTLRRLGRGMAAAVLVLAGVLVAAWLALHWAILPHIERWRPQLEASASRMLGVAVRIGGIEARSSGWVPALRLRDVVLSDAQGRESLRLPGLALALSPRSLLALAPRFEQVLIDSAQLELRRDARGQWFVGGLAVGDGGSDDEDDPVADWLFRQQEFVVRGGSLRLVDELRGAPPLALQDVDLVLRNGLRRHALRVDATPPAEWGERFSLRGRFTQPLLTRAGDWRRWVGTAYADLPRADLRALRRHVDLPFELSEGDGSLRAWVEWRNGEPQSATLDLALRAVTARLSPKVEPLALQQVEGRLTARRGPAGVELAARGFGFVTADGARWPRGDLSLSLAQAPGSGTWLEPAAGSPEGGTFNADELDLAVVAQIAQRLPLGEPLRRLLRDLHPRGTARALAARWDGPLDAPQQYQVAGRLEGLSTAAQASTEPDGVGRPGLRNVDLQLQASEHGGTAQLQLRRGALEFPGVFEQPLLTLDKLSAELAWSIEPAAAPGQPLLTLQVRQARFSNADAHGQLEATWRSGAGEGVGRGARFPGQLELSGTLADAQATRVARYLPLGLPESARHYVRDAVRGGRVARARFQVKGDLWDFPFQDRRRTPHGEFRIEARVEDATLAYVPELAEPSTASKQHWPALTRVAGELVFDRAAMQIRDARARLHGVELSQVHGGIPDLDRPRLALSGTARGPLADGLRFIRETPLAETIGPALSDATAQGDGELKLSLTVPLDDDAAPVGVQGSLTLAGNDVRLRPDTPMLAGARGRVDFTDSGFAVREASAQVLGGPLQFEGGQQPDGSLRFSGEGSATAEGLRAASEMGPVAQLAGRLQGRASYRLTLGLRDGFPELALTSDLVGMASTWPAPLDKTAQTPRPLRIESHLQRAGGAALRDEWQAALGSNLQAHYVRDLTGATARVLRGSIGIGRAASLPDAGVNARVEMQRLDLDAWQEALALVPATGAGGAAGNAANAYVPSTIELHAQELVAGSRRIGQLAAAITRSAGVWRVNLDAEQANGYLEYSPAAPGAAAGRVRARLSRLSIPDSDSDPVQTLLDAPSSLPALDIVVDAFELKGKRMGRLEVEADNQREAAAGRRWRLSRLSLAADDSVLNATGQWGASSDGTRRTSLDFRLELRDSGALLERLLGQRAVRGGRGELSGNVSWVGSPLSLAPESMDGAVHIALDAGQFLKVEPGVARLLGVLNLQALPRRLALDFRDIFQQGFSFDSITGDLRIVDGVAHTNNLRMRGVQAVVLMEGSADIRHETQDLRVVVVPEINAGTATLAYAAINPAVGIGAFLAQLVLRKPLIQAGTREFHISGSWLDPNVERVARKFDDPLPGTPPASAPSPTRP